jgi:zinc transport system substrate-binding protein
MHAGQTDAWTMLKQIYCLTLLFIAAACQADSVTPSVFVSIPPQKQFIERIAGDYVKVEVMLPPGESAETYSPTPRMMVSLSKAKSYFQIGVPFEKKITTSILSVNNEIRIVTCCDQILSENNPFKTDGNDLHIWNDPLYVQQLAKLMLDELIFIDPSHTREYTVNYQNFISELVDLDTTIKEKLTGGKTNYFIISHSALGMYAQRYGLVQLALEQNGKEIGARSLLSIINLARKEGIKTLFVIEQYKTPVIEKLAEELGARLINIDPLAEDYINNMSVLSTNISNSLHLQ